MPRQRALHGRSSCNLYSSPTIKGLWANIHVYNRLCPGTDTKIQWFAYTATFDCHARCTIAWNLCRHKLVRDFPSITSVGYRHKRNVTILSDRDDEKCVASHVAAFASRNDTHNILICWEHDALVDIAKALGVKKAPEYPDKSYVVFRITN